jgi:TPR repeat protein
MPRTQSLISIAAGFSLTWVAGCAQSVRGDPNQVYISTRFALFDTQSIDEAERYCRQYGNVAIFRGPYSNTTDVFACVTSSVSIAGDFAPDASAPNIDALHHNADNGDTPSMIRLGLIYAGFQKGVPERDFTQSMFWLRRAADRGDTNAMNFIGGAYIKGEIGVKADPVEARHWFTQAAGLGNGTAMYVLGLIYKDGFGTPPDRANARKWFQDAAAHGSTDAAKELNDIKTSDVGRR